MLTNQRVFEKIKKEVIGLFLKNQKIVVIKRVNKWYQFKIYVDKVPLYRYNNNRLFIISRIGWEA